MISVIQHNTVFTMSVSQSILSTVHASIAHATFCQYIGLKVQAKTLRVCFNSRNSADAKNCSSKHKNRYVFDKTWLVISLHKFILLQLSPKTHPISILCHYDFRPLSIYIFQIYDINSNLFTSYESSLSIAECFAVQTSYYCMLTRLLCWSMR